MAEYDFLAPTLKNALAKRNKSIKDKLNPLAAAIAPSASVPVPKAPSLAEAMADSSAPSEFKKAIGGEKEKRVKDMTFAEIATTGAKGLKEFATEKLALAMEKSPAVTKGVNVAATAIGSVVDGATAVKNIKTRADERAEELLDLAEEVKAGRKSQSDLVKAYAATIGESLVKGGGDILSTAINITPAGASMNALMQGGLEAIGQKENFDEATQGVDKMFIGIGKKMGLDDKQAEQFGTTVSSAIQTGAGFLGFKQGASKMSRSNTPMQNLKYAATDVGYNSIPAIVGSTYNAVTGTQSGEDKVKSVLGTAITAGAINAIASEPTAIGRSLITNKRGAVGNLEPMKVGDEPVIKDNEQLSREQMLEEAKADAEIAKGTVRDVYAGRTVQQLKKAGLDDKRIVAQLTKEGRMAEVAEMTKGTKKAKKEEPVAERKNFEPEVPKAPKKEITPPLFATKKKPEPVAKQPEPAVVKTEEVPQMKDVFEEPVAPKTEVVTEAPKTETEFNTNKEAWAAKRAQEEAVRQQAVAEKRMTEVEAAKQRKEANALARKQDAELRKAELEQAKADKATAKAKWHEDRANKEAERVATKQEVVAEEPVAVVPEKAIVEEPAVKAQDEVALAMDEALANATPEKPVDVFAVAEQAEKRQKAKAKGQEVAEVPVDRQNVIDEISGYSHEGRTFDTRLITKGLEKLRIRELTQLGGKLFTDIGNLLNSIEMVTPEGSVMSTGKWVRSKMSEAGHVKNRLLDTYGVTGLVKEITTKFPEGKELASKIEQGIDSYVAGIKDENLRSIIKQGVLDKIESSKYDMTDEARGFIAAYELKERLGRYGVEAPKFGKNFDELYKSVKDRFDKRTDGEAMNSLSLESQLYGDVASVMDAKQLIRNVSEDYVHGHIPQSVYDTFVKLYEGDPRFEQYIDKTLSDFKRIAIDESVAPRDISERGAKSSKILRESKAVEFLHDMNPITRMMNYADETGTLITYDDIFKTIQEARKQNPEVAKVLDGDVIKMLTEAVLGIKPTQGPFIKKFNDFANKVGAATIIGRGSTLTKSAFTTALRFIQSYAPEAFKAIMSPDGKIVKTDTSIAKLLDDYGMLEQFERDTAVGKVVDKAYSVSSGGFLDVMAKTNLATQFIRNIVGEPPKGKTLAQAFDDKLSSMTRYEREKTLYDLSEKIHSIAAFDPTTKSGFGIMNNRIFSALKTFNRATAGKIAGDTGMIIDAFYRLSKGQLKAGDVAGRTIAPAAWIATELYGAYVVAKVIMDATMDGNEEEKEENARRLASGYGYEKLASFVGNATDPSGVALMAGLVDGLVKVGAKAYDGTLTVDQAVNELRQIGVIDSTRKLLDVADVNEMGGVKYDAGDIGTRVAAFLGFGGPAQQQAVKNVIDKYTEEEKSTVKKIFDKVNKDTGYAIDDIQELFSQSKLEKKRTFALNRKTVSEVLERIDSIEGPVTQDEFLRSAYDGMEVSLDGKPAKTFLKNEITSQIGEIKKLAGFIQNSYNLSGLPDEAKSDFNSYLNSLRDKKSPNYNPKLFYDIVTDIVRPVTVNEEGVSQELGAGAQPLPYVATMLTERYEDVPNLATDFSKLVSDKLFKKVTMDKDVSQEEIDALDGLLGTLKKSSQWSFMKDSVSEAIATKLAEVANDKAQLFKLQATIDKSEASNLKEAFANALAIRGISVTEADAVKPFAEPTEDTDTTAVPEAVSPTAGGIRSKDTPILDLNKILGRAKESRMQFATPNLSGADKLAKLFDMTKGIRASK